MMPHEFFAKKEKELKDHKSRAYPKIANSFIENVIANSNENALKIVWYLSMSMKDTVIDETKRKVRTYTLDEKDITKETGLDTRTILKYLKTMQKTTVTFIDEKEKYEEFIQLIPRIKNNHNGTIDYDVYDVVAKLIIDVADNTSGTFVDVRRLLKLKNKHSIRLLPLLEKILSNNGNAKKQKTVSLEYLNSLFGTSYKRYSQLIKFVLEPAKEELDNNSTLTFEILNNRETLGKKGKPPIVSITIIPVPNNNYQTNFDAMMIAQDTYDKAKTTTTNKLKKQKALTEAPIKDKYIKFKVDKLYLDKIENELNYKDVEIMDEQKMFLDFCKKENKNYVDMSRSLYIHLKKKRELGL